MSGPKRTRIAVVLYPEVTCLDFVGPCEVLAPLPGAEVHFLAVEPGLVRSDTGGMTVLAGALDELPDPDIILVPGGRGSDAAMHDARLIGWLKRAHETSRWTTSVCTGSRILAAAGILTGLRATCHWGQMDELGKQGAIPTDERVVREGKIITAAGVSAGIDMGLRLAQLEAGDMLAQAIQLAIEYDPEPPFDSGSLKTAPKEIVAMVRAFFAQRQPAAAAR